MKKCRVCGEVKPDEDYNIKRSSKDGRRTDCRECQKAYHKDRYAKNPERHKEIIRKNQRTHTAKKHGMTKYDLESLYEKQGHSCAICGITEESYGKYLAIDHCHATGKVRGLLCTNCNTGLGNLRDNPTYLLRAIKYLEENSDKPT